ADLRKMDGAMDAALLRKMRRQPLDRSSLAAARRDLQADFDAYKALSQYPGEAEKFQSVVSELDRLDEASSKLVSMLAANGDLARVLEFENEQWRYASDRFDGAVQDLLLFNSNHVGEHLRTLERTAEWTVGGLLLGGLLSLVVTVFAVRLAERAVRERERILQ